jgi:hypothetical protein
VGLYHGVGSGKNKELAQKGKGHLLGVINATKTKNQMFPSGSTNYFINLGNLCQLLMDIGHGQG